MEREDLRTALERARRERPELRRTIDLQLELDALAGGAELTLPPGFAAAAVARLLAGVPAIDPGTLALDWAAVARRIGEVCAVVQKHDASLASAVAPLDATTAHELTLQLFAGETSDLTAFILTHALHPLLRAAAQVVLALPEARGWTRGHCPVCGGPPDLAVLEGEGGARRLLCARCDSEWPYARIGCPSCGNQDQASLGYFPAGDGPHRLYVCEKCRGYLKTVDRRETWGNTPMAAERVLALGLDLAAASAGYRPTSSRATPS